MIVVTWVSIALVILGSVPQVLTAPSAQTVALALSMTFAIVGTTLRRKSLGLWLIDAALVCLLIIGMLSDAPPVPLLVMGVYAAVFFAIFLSSRTAGLAWIVVGIAAQTLLAQLAPSYVAVGGLEVNVGIAAVIQMAVTGLWLWWAWHAIADSASDQDRQAMARESEIGKAILLQERTVAWREAITRTHETILNDIRYVLRAPTLDRGRLREQLLTTRDVRTALNAGARRQVDLADVVRQEFSGSVRLDDEVGKDLPLDVLEPVVREIVRNIERHAGATAVCVSCEAGDGQVRLVISDDGDVAPSGSAPSIGRSIVVWESLSELGGRVEEGPHRAVITVPTRAAPPAATREPLRILLSVVLAGSALGGSLQFVLLLAGSSPAFASVTLAAFVVTLLATAVVMRRRVASDGVVLVAAVAVAAVPWFLAVLPGPCPDNALALSTMNLSIDAFFGLLLCARSWRLWILVAPVVAGVLALALGFGSGCVTLTAGILVNSIVLVPVFIGLSLYSAAYAERRQREEGELWRREIAERARAEIAVDLARYLEDSVEQAWNLLWAIAEGAPLDDACRRRLRTLESAIRAAIQVDPQAAGGVTLAARNLVEKAVQRDIPVHVRALRGSRDDGRPLPPEILDLLERALLADPGHQASIHVFTDGEQDYLALTTTIGAAREAGILPEDSWRVADVSVEASLTEEDAGSSAEVLVLVRRDVTALAPSGAP